VSLSPGVNVSKQDLDMVKAVSKKPTIFARNLMRLVFDDEELQGKSLFGSKCNANKEPPKEPIDAVKRDAVISKY